jgi:hypothetical protein
MPCTCVSLGYRWIRFGVERGGKGEGWGGDGLRQHHCHLSLTGNKASEAILHHTPLHIGSLPSSLTSVSCRGARRGITGYSGTVKTQNFRAHTYVQIHTHHAHHHAVVYDTPAEDVHCQRGWNARLLRPGKLHPYSENNSTTLSPDHLGMVCLLALRVMR